LSMGGVGGGFEMEISKDADGKIVTDEAGNPVMVPRVDSGASPSSDRGRGSPLGDKSVASTDCGSSSYGRSGSTGSGSSVGDGGEGNFNDRAQQNLIKRLRQVDLPVPVMSP
jgi:hypothetical protein